MDASRVCTSTYSALFNQGLRRPGRASAVAGSQTSVEAKGTLLVAGDRPTDNTCLPVRRTLHLRRPQWPAPLDLGGPSSVPGVVRQVPVKAYSNGRDHVDRGSAKCFARKTMAKRHWPGKRRCPSPSSSTGRGRNAFHNSTGLRRARPSRVLHGAVYSGSCAARRIVCEVP
jgi:hypothetical protein